MSDELTQRVCKVIAASKRIPEERVTVDSAFEELGIDSMDAVEILFALENEFDIVFPTMRCAACAMCARCARAWKSWSPPKRPARRNRNACDASPFTGLGVICALGGPFRDRRIAAGGAQRHRPHRIHRYVADPVSERRRSARLYPPALL
jgi:acyl carrier protein